MNDEEFATYRSGLTRNVRTKIIQCPDVDCECILWTGAPASTLTRPSTTSAPAIATA